MKNSATPPPLPKRSRSSRALWTAIIICVLPVLAIALFYPVENWRGRAAWYKCKRDLIAQGEKVEWSDCIPPAVPDDQNFYKAPKMAEWFVGKGPSELAERLSEESLSEFSRRYHTNAVADITVVSLNDTNATAPADIVLRYDAPVLSLEAGRSTNGPFAQSQIIPLIVFQGVPLRTAIENLTRQANWKYEFDPNVDILRSDESGPYISSRWENITPERALFILLNNYSLLALMEPDRGVIRITTKEGNRPHLYAYPPVTQRIQNLMAAAIGTNTVHGPTANANEGFQLTVNPAKPAKTVRILLRAEKIPDSEDISDMFPSATLENGKKVALRTDPTDAGRFRVSIGESYTVEEYLAWSDQFASDFQLMRDALKRPYARMDGNYQSPLFIPLPNWIAFRAATRTLAQRVQCYLLLGEPEKALHELTLLHDLSRVLEEKPSGLPMTMVTTMVNSMASELYATTVAEGLRRHVWREPQLAAIQKQTAQINLLPLLARSFRSERASLPRAMEFTVAAYKTNSAPQKFPASILSKLRVGIPRGWIYQSYVHTTLLHQELIGSLDLTNQIVHRPKVDAFLTKMQTEYSRFHPYKFLAAIAMPNFTRAIRTLACNQTLMDETRVACALERYRLQKGNYPETLTALAPQFIEKLPHDIVTGQPLKYRRTDDGQFKLYSAGWNETDDNGTDLRQPGSTSAADGDWVYP